MAGYCNLANNVVGGSSMFGEIRLVGWKNHRLCYGFEGDILRLVGYNNIQGNFWVRPGQRLEMCGDAILHVNGLTFVDEGATIGQFRRG